MDELLLEGARGEKAVEIGSEKLGYKVSATEVKWDHEDREGTDMSSNGEMKTSLKLMI